ncbi:hypothetical protein IV74_GL002424 [Carnobacterium divergens DSM 20623]|uniref:Uncharacterized protein n=2 Tax=Carnobacterium divergens TaxID=2748 RepID=A0A0R2HPM6_CARDV|nr:hypothetical protein IV74_GL002424 [Carnobacterium divergens DSM 20623]
MELVAKMKKTLLLFMFPFLILVGCSGNEVQFEKEPSNTKSNKSQEEKILKENDSENSKVMDISEYNYKIPEAVIKQNNQQLLNSFATMKKVFIDEKSKEYKSQNSRFDVIPYEAGYNKERKKLGVVVLLVNVSGRDIDNVEFNLDLYLNTENYPQINKQTVKITKINTGGIAANTIMPYPIRFDDVDLDLESENFSSTDFAGSNMNNLIIRYED